MTRAERFWSKVDKRGPDECWPWTGASNRYSKHGQFSWTPTHTKANLTGAHRAAWMLTHGEIWTRAIKVCHRCDNPPCCNPAHLFLGTQKDNMRDALKKGRLKFPKPRLGEENNKAKLTVGMVAAVRQSYASGENLSDMSRRLGLARSTLREVVNGRNWRSPDCPVIPKRAPTKRLTDEQVTIIRADYADGLSQGQIAAKHGINQAYASRLVKNKSRFVPAVRAPQQLVLQGQA